LSECEREEIDVVRRWWTTGVMVVNKMMR